jgi:hypothetical protein
MTKEPNRFGALYGAAQAARAAGDRQKARTYAQRLIKICERADMPGRTELQAIRKIGSSSG